LVAESIFSFYTLLFTYSAIRSMIISNVSTIYSIMPQS